ncbi:MAG TPA: AzlD domain-containing protein [Ilumatobacteraceae bacterium]|nr:AzlD domain-containing protein [Ilumatobacteraceae bacterium]
MTVWIVVLASALCTYALRASALVIVTGGRLPGWIEQNVKLVAPAALGALVASSSLHNEHTLGVGIASGAAFVAARHLRSPYAALLVGFPTLWCAQLVVG